MSLLIMKSFVSLADAVCVFYNEGTIYSLEIGPVTSCLGARIAREDGKIKPLITFKNPSLDPTLL